jgi:phosphate/sulfate permease
MHGIAGGWFGWAIAIAALIVGWIQQRFDVIKNIGQQWWFSPSASAFIGFVIVLLFHAVFVAPYRAWRILHPFKVTLISGILESEYPAEKFQRQRVAVAIKNKSYR